jgi:hypothetical protein
LLFCVIINVSCCPFTIFPLPTPNPISYRRQHAHPTPSTASVFSVMQLFEISS